MKTKICIIAVMFLTSLSMSAQLDRSIRPKPGPAPKINLGTPAMFKLKNGLKVLVVENHKLPRVSATLTIDNTPPILGNKKGEDDLLGSMLGNGTTTISKDKFNEEVDFLGARLFFWDSGARASSLSKYFDKVITLMSDGIINPVFNQADFDSEKSKLNDNLKNQEKNVKVISSRIRNVVSYGKGHPYGEFTSQKTLKNVSLADIKNYYNLYYRPNNAYLVVVGDITVKQAKKLIKKKFSDWKSKNVPVAKLPEIPKRTKTTLYFVNMPNAVQSEEAVMETSSINKINPDYFDMILANKILGGGSTARLFMDLREDKAFTYGAYSSLQLRKYAPSRFNATAAVRNVVTDSAVVQFMKEINKIRTTKVSATELKDAKANYVGSFVIALEKPETIAQYALDIQRENLPSDFYTTYLKKLNAVTIDGVQSAANKYIKPNKEAIVVVGKAADVLSGLIKLNYPMVYLDTDGNITAKPKINIPIPAGVTAASVLNSYFKAIGGLENVNNIKTANYNYSAKVRGMSLILNVKQMAPNKISTSTSMMGNVMSRQVFDGTKAYLEARGQKKEITGKPLEEMKIASVPFAELGYLKTAKLLKIEVVNGQKAYVLQVTKNKKAFYNVKSGLKIMEITTQKMPSGKELSQGVSFSDYKSLNNVLIPYKRSMTFGPQKIDFNLDKVEFNLGVTINDFK